MLPIPGRIVPAAARPRTTDGASIRLLQTDWPMRTGVSRQRGVDEANRLRADETAAGADGRCTTGARGSAATTEESPVWTERQRS